LAQLVCPTDALLRVHIDSHSSLELLLPEVAHFAIVCPDLFVRGILKCCKIAIRSPRLRSTAPRWAQTADTRWWSADYIGVYSILRWSVRSSDQAETCPWKMP